MIRAILASLLLMVANTVCATAPEGYDILDSLASPPLKSDALLHQIRAFIVRHWKHHSRGCIVYTMQLSKEPPFRGTIHIEPAANGMWHIRSVTRYISSGRLIHRFDATSFNRYGPYLYFHDKSDKLVGAL